MPRHKGWQGMVIVLLLVVRADELPDESSAGATYEWTNDEYPELAESLATLEESRTDGASRVNAGARVVDAYEVDEYEGETDGEASKIASTLLGISRSKNYQHEEAG